MAADPAYVRQLREYMGTTDGLGKQPVERSGNPPKLPWDTLDALLEELKLEAHRERLLGQRLDLERLAATARLSPDDLREYLKEVDGLPLGDRIALKNALVSAVQPL